MLTTLERFGRKIIKADGDSCWEWSGGHNIGGYPRFQCGWENYAHRVAWTYAYGPIPKWADVCHHCDNPGCVRPSHLYLGGAKDNLIDASWKGRLYPNVKRGEDSPKAKLSWEKVREIRDLGGRGWSERAIAAEYGVTQVNVHYILTRRTWKE